MANVIRLKAYSNNIAEYTAAEPILPGMLIELDSTGKVKKHATAGGNASPMFALFDAFQGKDINDAYATGDKVQCWTPYPGDEVNALLEDNSNIAIGAFLESNGVGYVQAHTVETLASADAQVANTVYSRPIVGQALEAHNLTTLEGSDSSLVENTNRIRLRIV